MRYFSSIIAAIIVTLVQVSLFSSMRFFFPYLSLVFIAFVGVYASREDNISLLAVFISGIFVDLFSLGQIGATSADLVISLLVFTLLGRLIPSDRGGKYACLISASIVFSLMQYITANFLASNGISGLFYTLPLGLINGILACFVLFITDTFFPLKKERKLRL